MIGTWMMWTLVVSGCLGVSALLGEAAMRERGWPTRWPWAIALVASVVLPVRALLARTGALPAEAGASGEEGWVMLDPAWIFDMGSDAVTRVPGIGEWSERLDAVATLGWIVLAVVAITLLVGGLVTLNARAARWHRARVAGENVLLSKDFGPALVGVVHPEIVLPRWALRMPEDDQRLACMHEAEHRAARDTWLLLTAALVVAAMPWNAALWWQVRRLRAAVEVDCDTRVLARGASRRAYGSLLLELGSAAGRSPLPTLAFARSESLLERRLKMIVRNVGKRRPLRSVLAVGASAALFAVACDAPAPTTLDGPAASAQASDELSITLTEVPLAAGVASRVTGDLKSRIVQGEVRFFVDDVQVSDMPELDAEQIDRVEVRKTPDGEASSVYLYRVKEKPLVYLDGVRMEGKLSDLAPEDIDRVEVLKGGAAEELYGPEASGGVIRVRTKKASEGGVIR